MRVWQPIGIFVGALAGALDCRRAIICERPVHGGQDDPEARPPAGSAVDVDTPFVGSHELPDDREADAGSARSARPGTAAAPETGEDVVQILGCDPDARVRDLEDRVARITLDPDSDPATPLRVAERIREQVRSNLLEACVAPLHLGGRDVHLEVDSRLCKARGERLGGRASYLRSPKPVPTLSLRDRQPVLREGFVDAVAFRPALRLQAPTSIEQDDRKSERAHGDESCG